MKLSLRFELASRYAAAVAVGIALVAAVGYVVLRDALDREIDASLLSVASIQASSLTDDPTGRMHFHEWELTPEEASSLGDLTRYAQVWSERGESLLRSQYLTTDLPVDPAALRRAARGDLAWGQIHFGDRHMRAVYYPLGRLGPRHERHILEVAAPLVARDRTLRAAGFFLAGVVLLVSIGSLLGSWWLAGKTVRPVNEIIAQAETIGGGRPGERISAYAETKEFARLVQVLNGMLARIDRAFEAQRRFTADASHELRSPLTALRGELELARRRERTAEEYRRVIDSALEEVDRLGALAEDLLTLARSDAGVMAPRLQHVDLTDRLQHATSRLRRRIEAKNLRLSVSAPPEATALLDRELLDRLIWNLLDNAVKFTTPGGRVETTVSVTDGEITLEVADTGPGIREDILPRIFERFARADDSHAAEGTGLGLSIVRAIARAHGGSVSAVNRPEGGARFRVVLPRYPRT